jgi:hypothetical protein
MADITAQQVITAILTGVCDSELDRVSEVTRERQKIVGQMNAVRLKVGDRVELFGLSPKTLNGLIGEVSTAPRGRGSKRFDVKLDHETFHRGRVTDTIHGIPAQCLKVIADGS